MTGGKLLVGIIAGVAAFTASRYSGLSLDVKAAALLAACIALLGAPVGLLVGYFISRDSDVDTRGYRVIAWTNLLAWVIPVVGVVISTMTWLFSRSSDTGQKFYANLGQIGLYLAVGSAAVGGGLAQSEFEKGRSAQQLVTRTSVDDPFAKRSPERCAFAAIEAWPRDEYLRHCR